LGGLFKSRTWKSGIGGDDQVGFFGDHEKGAEPVCGGRAINAGG
jgi:hypothetical protein